MLTQRLANIVFSILVIMACAYFAIVAQGFEAAGLLASSGLPSRFFPQLLLGFTAFCAAVVFFVYVTKGEAGDEGQTVFSSSAEARRGLLALAAAVVSYIVWNNFGYIAMALTSGPLLCLAMGVRSPVIYGVVLALAAGVYLIFTQFLGTQF
ncbi:MAG: tripartite tricarboxylate transporter TctB family protein [Paracoccaceae bacterium]|nr:tripartite tricarboxylate transporter TctB family protein [Paracoccaceae bacterium]MDE2914022.1 tripartite tricarboxylate transporter TctB family protein [Paracoccaceae bacterium]